jgi:diphthamide biosynthesis protein 4
MLGVCCPNITVTVLTEKMRRLKLNFYEILSLPSPGTTCVSSKHQIKLAYHRALLKHHPDKADTFADDRNTKSSYFHPSDETQTGIFTIDEITTAYRTLSDPLLRAEYDRSLRLQRFDSGTGAENGGVFHIGLEIVDLEDLSYEERSTATAHQGGEQHELDTDDDFWCRSCRCGHEKGFVVTQAELEREAEHGEIVVGCRGCSLWIKVMFAVHTEEDGNAEGNGIA